ncbi:MAG: efflux transporter outer membrane subunit [Muribaculaceae bacterium]|nr:efflux transporter outer membrane subunit [Muribaculaceae bacterium]
MKKLIFIPALILLALTSCKLGHKFAPVDTRIPGEYKEKGGNDSFSMADVDWWRIYTDPTMRSIIERTLKNNLDLKIADARIREVASLKRISTAALFPEVTANAYGQKEGLNYGGDNFSPDPEIGIKASASWEIDLWGNLRWLRDKSIADYLASVESRRALQVSLVAQTAQAYCELMSMDNELRIVQHTLTARREQERLAKLRFEGGLTSEIPYQQAKVEVERTATRVPVLKRNIAMKEHQISLLMGEFPGEIIRRGDTRNLQLPEEIPVGLPSHLLERRPDIRMAEQQLIAANAAMGVAYTNRFPRLTLTAVGGVESDEFSGFLKSPMYFLSGSILGPLFDAGKRQAQYRSKQAAYEQAILTYEKTVMNAFNEVMNAIVEFNRVKEIYNSAYQLERSARTTMEKAQLQYINGMIVYLDVLDAQRIYFDAQVGLSNAMLAKQLCIIRLYSALGGGW